MIKEIKSWQGFKIFFINIFIPRPDEGGVIPEESGRVCVKKYYSGELRKNILQMLWFYKIGMTGQKQNARSFRS
jgi:hypothetical protein